MTATDYAAPTDALNDDVFIEDDTLDEESTRFVVEISERILQFCEFICDVKLFPYQRKFALRLIESLIINDGEEITALFSRQSGKTETVACTIAGCMVVLPRLAKSYKLFAKFDKGIMVGVFAPVSAQAETLYERVVGFLTSDHATNIMLDPEIDEIAEGKGGKVTLKKCGSFVRVQTANPRAKIESKSYMLIVIDESQEADEFTVRKSIHPMGAFYNATIVKTGTASRHKGDFYKAIRHNIRRETAGGHHRRNHFEFDWRECAKHNPNYKRYVLKERERLGEDSDEFKLSFLCKWLLDRGMLVTSERLDSLMDKSMVLCPQWNRTPIIIGIDPARAQDSTVVTAVFVDWYHPDEYGFYEHRPINWLEIEGDDWEAQYPQVLNFIYGYSVWGIAIDAQGVGDAFASRMQALLPGANIHGLNSNLPDQTKRWTHLIELIQKDKLIIPGHSRAKRLRTWKRFYQQMTDAEKTYKGPNLIVEAPNESDAHDDYVDSLALACWLSKQDTMPEVETYDDFFRR